MLKKHRRPYGRDWASERLKKPGLFKTPRCVSQLLRVRRVRTLPRGNSSTAQYATRGMKGGANSVGGCGAGSNIACRFCKSPAVRTLGCRTQTRESRRPANVGTPRLSPRFPSLRFSGASMVEEPLFSEAARTTISQKVIFL